MPRTGRLHIIGLAAAVVLWGCGGWEVDDLPEPDLPDIPNVSSMERPTYVLSSAKWSNVDFPLRVCTDDAGMGTRMAWTREAVNRSWAQVANLDFSDFGSCGSDPTVGVKVNWVSSTTGSTSHLGKLSGGGWSTVTLGTDAGWPQNRTHRTGAHEFGHVLAISHEQNRPDFSSTPDFGQCNTQGPNGDTTYNTQYDPVSLMNYCWNGYSSYNTIRTSFDNSYPAQISPGDVVGALETYGTRARPSVIGVGGKCLTSSYVSSGANLTMEFCEGKEETQLFFLDHLSPNQELKALEDPELEVRVLGTATGTQAELYYGLGGTFYLNRFKLSSMGLCLASNGTTNWVRMAECEDGDTAQEWYIDDGRLINEATSQCLRRYSNNYLYTSSSCQGDDSEVTWLSRGQLRIGPDYCMDIKGGYAAIGYDKYNLTTETLQTLPYVQMYPCKITGNTGSYNQFWVKRGQLLLSTDPSKCLDVQGNVTSPGRIAQLYPCKDSTVDRSNQMWDFHW